MIELLAARLRRRRQARDVARRDVKRHSRAIQKLRRLLRRSREVSDVSSNGVKFIAEFEGFYPEPYNDPAGFATVGYGHLLGYRPVTEGDRKARWVHNQEKAGRLTEPEARTLLARSLRSDYEPAVRRLFLPGGPFYGRFEQTFYDALVSATYNLGTGVVIPGTPGFETIGRAVAAGDRKGVAEALLLYDKAGGRALPGLTRRRRAERRLILTGNYSTEFP